MHLKYGRSAGNGSLVASRPKASFDHMAESVSEIMNTTSFSTVRILATIRLSLYGLEVDQQEPPLLCTCVTMETRHVISQRCLPRFHDSGPRPSCQHK
jgi:hypothetical protein